MTIHFICRGNVLRSYIAETYLRSLNLSNVQAVSSGTIVDLDSEQERAFFAATRELLDAHGILRFAKDCSDQLTAERLENSDVVVCVNQRAYEEAVKLVDLPSSTRVWNIVDIGEGDRIVVDGQRHDFEEIIYQEVTAAVDALVQELKLQ